jgi:glycosyltransferase involved in cell wall biosynthesis
MKKSKPFISIIIPTLNEEQYLPQLLEDLTKQTFQNFEVIHVDAQSTDKTTQKAAQFADQLELKSIASDQRNVGHQRNLGSQKARGEWIIFMDADNRLPNHFLQGIKYQLDKKQNVNAFTCWLDVKSYQTTHQPAIQLINFGLSLFKSEAFGAMLGIRAKLMEKYCFSEKQKFCEDIALVKKLIQDGYNFSCFRDPQYFTSPRRFEKEGLAKITTSAIEARLRMLLNDNLENFDKYPMMGGSYYDEVSQETSSQPTNRQPSQNQETENPSRNNEESRLTQLIDNVESFLLKASKKQLARAKRIWLFVLNQDES